MVLLSELPHDHAERNRRLDGCWYKFKFAKDWKQIKGSFKIVNKTYNDLGPAWTENDIFCWRPNASLTDGEAVQLESTVMQQEDGK